MLVACLVNKIPPTPVIFWMCGKQRVLNLVFLEVWQGKELPAHFLDVWQIQKLAKKGSPSQPGSETERRGGYSP